jgi:DNA oxidative demethylase
MSGLSINGARWLPACIDGPAREQLVREIGDIAALASPFTPVMPRTGKPFSVTMTNCGALGWMSDRAGYRYQATHPETGEPWPPMPDMLYGLWTRLTGCAYPPEACLVNFYGENARMGLHVDRDEAARTAPVVSISLGDTAIFRVGTETRRGPTQSARLQSGDVVILENEARHAHHGIDRVIPGTSRLLEGLFPDIRRINLTLRRVTPPDES